MERSEETIFAEALEKPAKQRAGYLDEACAGDPELRRSVESLLEAYSQGEFLESPAHDLGATIDLPIAEQPGDTIGPYKLLQQIGEGGMGVVYMAEQSEPVERRVALKVIKPGMDTRKVIARFEAERQALAMMDHPNIAKVFDAGTTETGRPFFVMELVKGVAITKYCDDNHRTTRERLELFIPICQAIQHAHQKGIIHRDIKPTNVLVAEYDDKPVAKVIDFGVAKATDHRLTEKTMFTEFGQVLGTFEYMSPEQAKLNQWDVDTRSDIYSLGVLLYELLSGETPFESQRLRHAALDEILRVIREEEPLRPSLRLSTSESLPSIAANRRIEPRQLSQLVRGELDWIVMKSLEKDRTRRYATASKLAEDIGHYLNDEPVEACPPSTAYRLRKFARRNRPFIATIGAVAAALVVGTGVATWQAVRATHERNRAVLAEATAEKQAQRAHQEAHRANREAENARNEANIARAVNEFLNKDLLAQANPYAIPGTEVKLRDVLDLASEKIGGQFDDDPLFEASIRQTLAETYLAIAEYEQAERHSRLAHEIRLRTLGENDLRTLESLRYFGVAQYRRGRHEQSEQVARALIAAGEHEHGPHTPLQVGAYNLLGLSLQSQGNPAGAADAYRTAIEIDEQVSGKKNFRIMGNLAIVTVDHDEKVRLLRDALRIGTQEAGEDHIAVAHSMFWLGFVLGPESDEAAELHQRALEIREKAYGPDHPITLDSRAYLVWVDGTKLLKVGKHREAINTFTEAIELQPRMLLHVFFESRGEAFAALGEWENAAADLETAIDRLPQAAAWLSGNLGRAYAASADWSSAAKAISRGLEHRPDASQQWLQLAPLLILAGEKSAYRDHCREMVQQFAATDAFEHAERTCKVCLLTPDAFPLEELPRAPLVATLDDGTAPDWFLPWGWTTRALLALRSGDPEKAIEFARRAETTRPSELVQATYHSLLAMSLQKLGKKTDASQALQSARDLIDQLQKEPSYQGHHDLLIAKILYDEAKSTLEGE